MFLLPLMSDQAWFDSGRSLFELEPFLCCEPQKGGRAFGQTCITLLWAFFTLHSCRCLHRSFSACSLRPGSSPLPSGGVDWDCSAFPWASHSDILNCHSASFVSFVCSNYTATQCFFFASRASSLSFAALLQSFDPRFSLPNFDTKVVSCRGGPAYLCFLLAMANVDIFLGLADTEVNKAVSWLEDARHMPATSGFSPAQWLWHWLSSSPAFAPLTEAA